MTRDENITRFVRETLGCECPEEVFRSIEFTRKPQDNASLIAKIVIGGRLLIYIAEIMDSIQAASLIEKLLREGINERDSSGLNRFRLVLASDNPISIKDKATNAFESLRGDDEKAHLHMIDRNDAELSSILK